MTSTEYPNQPHHILKLTDNPTDHETIILRSTSNLMMVLPFDNGERLIMSDELKYVTRILKEAMNESTTSVGVAAPQVGYNMAVFVTRIPKEIVDRGNVSVIKEQPETIYINPSYKVIGNETNVGIEACMSVDNKIGIVRRPSKISVSYYNETGKYVKDEILEGYNARVFLHEYDHLCGILFIDKADQLYDRETWVDLLNHNRDTNNVEWLNSVGLVK